MIENGTIVLRVLEEEEMAEGKIKRVTDKGFGFIETDSGSDMFFHSSALEGVNYDDLREGQLVSYNVGSGPKGPRAENVQLVED
ncbi:Cold-shock protein, DNA-binding domain protein [Rhodopirellula maiorica SM1]|uniref:Cold-shock protein, DNA-binding domain protein n=3 Tax=Pirellulaceae TaxID=2691357 RepID=M5RCS7_9BACT|nr:cold shock domain-containing protein [Rhodopirellula maiorica]EMI17190.1 Cold-shock protein, DNA-binding domain protein [Rhodopirellula maiorica SM1]